MGFPLHKVYPYSLHIGEDSSILGTQELVDISEFCDQLKLWPKAGLFAVDRGWYYPVL